MNFLSVISAIKRCEAMGKPHIYHDDFYHHKLAPGYCNYMLMNEVIISTEMDKEDHLNYLITLDGLSRCINKFCDNNKIADDFAAEYYLYMTVYMIRKWEKIYPVLIIGKHLKDLHDDAENLRGDMNK